MNEHGEHKKTPTFAVVLVLLCLFLPPIVALYTFITFLEDAVPPGYMVPYTFLLYMIFGVGAYAIMTVAGKRHGSGSLHTPPRYEDPARWPRLPWTKLTMPILYFFCTLVLFYFVGRSTQFVFKWYQWGGMVLALSSLVLWILARIQLAEAHRRLHATAPLVTDGLYTHIRHPMYVFSFLAVLGIVIFLSQWVLIVPLLVLLALQVYRAYQEDAALEEAFGEEYRRYKAARWL